MLTDLFCGEIFNLPIVERAPDPAWYYVLATDSLS